MILYAFMGSACHQFNQIFGKCMPLSSNAFEVLST